MIAWTGAALAQEPRDDGRSEVEATAGAVGATIPAACRAGGGATPAEGGPERETIPRAPGAAVGGDGGAWAGVGRWARVARWVPAVTDRARMIPGIRAGWARAGRWARADRWAPVAAGEGGATSRAALTRPTIPR